MFHQHPIDSTRWTNQRAVQSVAMVVMTGLLLATIPMMARVPATTDVAARPMPAPSPTVVANDVPAR